MNKFENSTYLMAARLKSLRESRGLSHLKLSQALQQKYDIKISKDILIAYEAPQYHAREGANNGMSARYLRCLADFYGVSSDYILGLSDYSESDVDIVKCAEITGLSTDAIYFLEEVKTPTFRNSKIIEAINILLSEKRFDESRNFWKYTAEFLFNHEAGFNLLLDFGEYRFGTADVLTVLLTANNNYLRELRKELHQASQEKEGAANGKA